MKTISPDHKALAAALVEKLQDMEHDTDHDSECQDFNFRK